MPSGGHKSQQQVVKCAVLVSMGECAGHLSHCSETHPEGAGSVVASWGGGGPLGSRLGTAALGL